MYRKLSWFLMVLVLMPGLLLAEDGKIRGTVKDKDSGEPLIGANILVEGTTLGAATDVNGDYIILSVPPGVYTLKSSFIGYAPVSISNVRVSSNITTSQDFQLTSSAVEVRAVEIVAERPLIQRNTTNTVRFATQEDIENLPIRGVQNILALEAGVVLQNNQIYVRGGRQGEVAYYVDGANTTNPAFNNASVTVIQEAIEEIQLQAGGYTAEFGGSNSAIARTTVRTGGQDFKASIDYQTDDFAKPGEEFLGTSAFGYRNAVLTLSGPVFTDLRFFIAGQHNYVRNRQQFFIEPFRFDSLMSDARDPRGAGFLLPYSVAFGRNHIPNNWVESNTLQGTLLYDISPLKFRFTGSFQRDRMPIDATIAGGSISAGGQRGGNIGGLVLSEGVGGWPTALESYFNQRRKRTDYTTGGLMNLRATHVVDASTFYEVSFGWQTRSFTREDPDFGLEWKKYVDSVENAALGYTGWGSFYAGPDPYSVIDAFQFRHENTPNNTFAKNRQTGLNASGDLTTQLFKNWELKTGGAFSSWVVRNFTVSNIRGAMEWINGVNGRTPRTFSSENERRVTMSQRGTINHYGYDVDGNETDADPDGPRKPLFASAYVQNKLEYQDLVVNFGARWEYFDTKAKTFPDPLNPPFNTQLDVIDETQLVEKGAFSLVLPRVSFSFPVTNNTVFYAQYGKYAQMPSLNQLYIGNTTLSRTVSINTRGNAFLTPVGFLLEPERTTSYEMGIRQTLTDNFAFTLSGFYKDLKDQLAVRHFVSPTGTKVFTAYLNEDFGTVKGFELTLELRRVSRLAARMNYTMSDAQGTASNPRSGFGAIEQNIGRPSNFINQLDFNQTHRGSILLDYRFNKDDGGPILQGMGLNLLLTFNSGHNYTKIREPQELGQANPWNVGVRPLIDPRSSFPQEPVNASKTPWIFNVDLNFSKLFVLTDAVDLEFYVKVLNAFNSKHVINVYPTTGTPEDDGWLGSAFAAAKEQIPNYSAFYRAINLDNRWAYMNATGNDLYGSPRQIRVGLKLDIQ